METSNPSYAITNMPSFTAELCVVWDRANAITEWYDPTYGQTMPAA